MSVSFVKVNSNYDMDGSGSSGYQLYVVDCDSNSVDLKLTGSDAFDGSFYQILRVDSNSSNTLTLNSYHTINGNSTKTLNINNSANCIFDENAGNWIMWSSSISL